MRQTYATSDVLRVLCRKGFVVIRSKLARSICVTREGFEAVGVSPSLNPHSPAEEVAQAPHRVFQEQPQSTASHFIALARAALRVA